MPFIMEVPSLLTTSLIAGAIGIASHLGYFIHGEHHKYSHRYLAVFTITPILVFVGLLHVTDNASMTLVAKTTVVATFSYFTALVTSILTYRIFFHPLRNFPGPFSYRFSKLVQVANIAKNSDNYIQAEQLRQKYGDIVR
jgi:tryprostatin B 6-hydroxylase